MVEMLNTDPIEKDYPIKAERLRAKKDLCKVRKNVAAGLLLYAQMNTELYKLEEGSHAKISELAVKLYGMYNKMDSLCPGKSAYPSS